MGSHLKHLYVGRSAGCTRSLEERLQPRSHLISVAWIARGVTDTDADDSVLEPEHISQMKMLDWYHCQPCLLFSSSHKKLG